MATWQHELVDPPKEERARELWLQHAAGFILFEDVRRYAREQIDPSVKGKARAAAEKGIDDALYGLMGVIDGVTGRLANEKHAVYLNFVVQLVSRGKSKDRVLQEIDLQHGDGMRMGIHGWIEGDFGKHPVALPLAKDS
jgi:hypothetical protein